MSGANAHIYPSSFKHETRMLRITRTLACNDVFERIYILATWEQGLPEEEQLDAVRTVWRVRTRFDALPRTPLWRVLRLLEWTVRGVWRLRRARLACVNPHSLPSLPMAVVLKLFHRSRLVYDTHELETESANAHGFRKIVGKVVERMFMWFVDRTVVTSDGFGNWYRAAYPRVPVRVIKNYPYARPDQGARSTVLRELCAVALDDLLFLYPGAISEGRGVERLLDVFSACGDRKHVVFMGYGPLVDLVRDHATRRRNIHFVPAVAPADVARYTSSADVGVSLIEPTCLSYRYTLPNKVLECLNVGVPVIVSDFPDMASLVEQHGCGWTTAVDTDALLQLVERIDVADVASKRPNAERWAREHTWEREEVSLLEMYQKLR